MGGIGYENGWTRYDLRERKAEEIYCECDMNYRIWTPFDGWYERVSGNEGSCTDGREDTIPIYNTLPAMWGDGGESSL